MVTTVLRGLAPAVNAPARALPSIIPLPAPLPSPPARPAAGSRA